MNLQHGLSFEEYEKLEGLRASGLKLLHRSPAHFKSHAERETPALRFGRLFHLAMQNGERFMDLLRVEPDFVGFTRDGKESSRSKEAKEKKEQWKKDLPKECIVMTHAEADTLIGMVRAVQAHRLLKNLIKNGVRETSLQVDDPETGLKLKCRPDFISETGYCVDFKTTIDARPRQFIRHIFDEHGYFYILSAAHYAHCGKVSGAYRSDRFFFVAIEKEPPHGITVFPMDSGCLDVGESHRGPLTKLYAKCLREDDWPCYPVKAVPVEIPGWVQYPDYPEPICSAPTAQRTTQQPASSISETATQSSACTAPSSESSPPMESPESPPSGN